MKQRFFYVIKTSWFSLISWLNEAQKAINFHDINDKLFLERHNTILRSSSQSVKLKKISHPKHHESAIINDYFNFVKYYIQSHSSEKKGWAEEAATSATQFLFIYLWFFWGSSKKSSYKSSDSAESWNHTNVKNIINDILLVNGVDLNYQIEIPSSERRRKFIKKVWNKFATILCCE